MGMVRVVATPIGNLEDVSLRALAALGEADLLFAEDTRRTRILLDRHGIPARPVSLHEHNEASRIDRALRVLREDGVVALVSDAGTPLVSDPGARLVAAAIEDGHRVEALPGASAVLAALTVSGLCAGPFTFVGFPPRRSGARRTLFESYRGRPETLIFFESPRRLVATLRELRETLGERRACVGRELTKLHEEARRGTLGELADSFADPVRGEITLVVEGAMGKGADEVAGAGEPAGAEAVDERIRELLAEGGRPREIAARLARQTGVPRRHIYARALALREKP
jgi:16S rRNA (cytidine1402-2'-O)-methyltransferase